MNIRIYGIVARFATPKALLAALRGVRDADYRQIEVNTPFSVDGVEEFLPGRPAPIARVMLAAALAGAGGGYFLQWFAARDYPLNVGGRPLHSWPAFVPVTFELTVLAAAVAGVFALLWLIQLPRLDHPIFHASGIERATQDRFFLCVRADDPRFETTAVRRLLERLEAETIEEVLI